MKTLMDYPVPQNEAKRIKVLWQYDILDTVPEEVFDELASLAGLICGAPISLISLVDENRQWFKSKIGLDLNETKRDVSLCAHAIMQNDLFIIPDATLDERFKDFPLVTEYPKIRFYAGTPLVTPDGHALGTLCVLDKVPRQLDDNQKQALRVLARHVMVQLELRRHSKELAGARDDCDRAKVDLTAAKVEIARLRKQLAAGKSTARKKPLAAKKKKPAPSRARR
jgi:GAF domain-containing protein